MDKHNFDLALGAYLLCVNTNRTTQGLQTKEKRKEILERFCNENPALGRALQSGKLIDTGGIPRYEVQSARFEDSFYSEWLAYFNSPQTEHHKRLDGSVICKTCESPIEKANVAHPVWLKEGPGPCAGTGEVEYEERSYCAFCEKKPDFNGAPIYKSIREALPHVFAGNDPDQGNQQG